MGLRSRLEDVCRIHALDALYVFGSRAEEVCRDLEADPFLAVNVIRGERLFFRDAHRIDEYELFVLRRAGDLAPFERERLAMIDTTLTLDG